MNSSKMPQKREKDTVKEMYYKDIKLIRITENFVIRRWKSLHALILNMSVSCTDISMQGWLLPLPLEPHVPPCWPGIRSCTSSSAVIPLLPVTFRARKDALLAKLKHQQIKMTT